MNALLRKEIRDAVRWLPLGVVLLGVVLTYVCRSTDAPQLSTQLFTVTWFSTMLYGLFLSLVTFLPDEREAARAFLIQRGVAPEQILRTRILVGLAVYGLGMFIPLGILAAYLAAIGPEHSPVSSWQVVPALAAVVAGSIFYFAGIVISCRSASWFGTRLLPLAAAVGGSFLSISILAGASLWVTMPFYILSCISSLLMAFAARHAFVRMPSQVSPARFISESLVLPFILLASSLLVVGALGLLPINFVSQSTYRYAFTEFDKDGMPIYVVRERGVEAFETIPMIDPAESPPEHIEIAEFGTPFMLGLLAESLNRFDPTRLQVMGDRQVFLEPSGYLLVYRMNQGIGLRIESVVSADGFSLPNEPRGKPFQKISLVSRISFSPIANLNFARPNSAPQPSNEATDWQLVTNEGIWKLDLEKRTMESVLKESIDLFAFPSVGGDAKIVIQSGDSLRVYKRDGDESSKFSIESSFQIAAKAGGFLCYRDNDNWTYIDGYGKQEVFNVTRTLAGKTHEYAFSLPAEAFKSLGRVREESPFIFAALPALLTVGSLLLLQSFSTFNQFEFAPLFLQMLASIVLTIYATHRRGLGMRSTVVWCLLAGLLGLGVPLAVIAIYPVVVYETCTACTKRRRVEHANCEYCGAEWDTLPTEGIEIVESETVKKLAAVG
jgi:hypothetical protein